jgi:hypothetical protein
MCKAALRHGRAYISISALQLIVQFMKTGAKKKQKKVSIIANCHAEAIYKLGGLNRPLHCFVSLVWATLVPNYIYPHYFFNYNLKWLTVISNVRN